MTLMKNKKISRPADPTPGQAARRRANNIKRHAAALTKQAETMAKLAARTGDWGFAGTLAHWDTKLAELVNSGE